MDALRRNNHYLLRVLLTLHGGLGQRDLDQALLHAVTAGYTECSSALLSRGASVNARDSHENTVLMLACQLGHEQIVSLLLENGANADYRLLFI